ncbi:MAG TPA: paraquat-inducible protein A, partial [Flammeovirgaceae bacterium]|nr:paraquat-inducible protein A [Flammeovirgaceae bacterium]
PLIEIDARIAEVSFTILGEKIFFTNQVLYYKSKSILEVVQLMLSQNQFDLTLVGLLVLTFSLIFPICKLICSIIYLYKPNSRMNPLIAFMVVKSGKWSMADVLVIAIFMAYIGFDGIISEQLNQIENISLNLDLVTTNNSNLLFGFYLFTSFVFLSLLTSQKIQTTCTGC